MEIRLTQKVGLGDNTNYAVKGIKTFVELETGENIHLSNILYVISLKKEFGFNFIFRR